MRKFQYRKSSVKQVEKKKNLQAKYLEKLFLKKNQ